MLTNAIDIDIVFLLERKNMWYQLVHGYLFKVLIGFCACHMGLSPLSSRKAYISTLSKDVNKICCVDYLYIDKYCLIHFMDFATRSSTDTIVENKALSLVIGVFEETRITHI